MAKILGLDLGTNSIGWAVVEVNKKGQFNRVIDCGVRIFPKGVNVDTKNKESSKNKERRDARQTRRKHFRYKLRRRRLVRELERMGIIPDQYFFTNQRKSSIGLKKTDLWNHTYELFSLRKRALYEQLTLPEIGRIFVHINKHRGFKSNRKEEAKINENEEAVKERGKVKKRISELKKRMEDLQCDTIGEYYFYLIEQNKDSHNPNEPKLEKTEDFTDAIRGEGAYTLREMFEDEFDRIWEKQKGYYPSVLTDGNKEIIRNDCIFYQRKLRSAQHLRNRCSLEFKRIVVYEFDKLKLENQLMAIQYKASDEQEYKNLNDSQVKILSEFIIKNKYRASVGDFIASLKLWNEISKSRRQNKVQFVFKGLPIAKQIRKKYLPCAPTSSFEYQEYRIWEQLNRLTFSNSDVISQPLEIEQKNELAQILEFEEKIPFKGRNEITVIKILGLPKETEFNLEQKNLIGNKTQSRLRKALGEKFWDKLTKKEQQTLWHNIQFSEDKEWLSGNRKFIEEVQRANRRRYHKDDEGYCSKNNWLDRETTLGLAEKMAKIDEVPDESTEEKISRLTKKIAEITFDPDYAPFSTKALKKLLVYMKQGHELVSASYEVYDKYISEVQDANIKLEYKIPSLAGNSLKNPIVERALVEAIGIINSIIDEHGKPDRVRIEMGRELKMPKVAREERNLRNKNIRDRREYYADFLNKHKDIERNNYEPSSPDIKKFEMFLELNYSQTAFDKIKKHITAKEFYSFLGAKLPTKKEKYLLWLECDRMDPYEGKTISLAQLFTPAVEIEHIIPYSRSMDNSMMNKTLAFRTFNAKKGNKTPLEFFENDENELDEFKKRVKHFPEAKKDRFLMKSKDLGGFLNSQMVNNAYIAKQIREHLLKSFKSEAIEMTNGQMTELVRSSLALDQILNPVKRADGYNIRGKAWCIYNGNEPIKFIERGNDVLPTIYNGYKVVKGAIYNNKFYPAKSRGDHRHHAVDALVTALISLKTQKELTACTEGYYLKNGTPYSIAQIERMYNDFSLLKNDIDNEHIRFVQKFEEKNGRFVFSREARTEIREELYRDLGLYENNQILEASKDKIQAILVSHKNEKIDSQPRKKIYNPNGTPKMVNGRHGKYQARSGGDYVRSNMFEANPYGQTNDCAPNEYVKRVSLSSITLSQIPRIVDSAIRAIVIENISRKVQEVVTDENLALEGDVKELITLRAEEANIKEQLGELKGRAGKEISARRKMLLLQKEDTKRAIDYIIPNKDVEKAFKQAFDKGTKNAFNDGFFLKNEGLRKRRMGIPENAAIRQAIPIKKVRVKFISSTMKAVKLLEMPRNKKFLKPDDNYTIALYGDLFDGGSSGKRLKRKFEPISWFQKAQIDSENQKRKKQNLPKLKYFEQTKESLDFLFELKHNDMFIVFEDDPNKINWNDSAEILNRLFRVGKFVQTSGEVRLARHNKSNVNLDKGNPWVSKEDIAGGEGDVLSVSPSTFRGIPIKVNELGIPDIEKARAFIEKYKR